MWQDILQRVQEGFRLFLSLKAREFAPLDFLCTGTFNVSLNTVPDEKLYHCISDNFCRNPDSFKSLFLILPQDVYLLPGHQDIFFPSRHQSSLVSHAVSWEEDCCGHSRGIPRHQPAGRQPGSPANSARLPAPDTPAQLQGAFSIHTRCNSRVYLVT